MKPFIMPIPCHNWNILNLAMRSVIVRALLVLANKQKTYINVRSLLRVLIARVIVCLLRLNGNMQHVLEPLDLGMQNHQIP